MKSGRLFEAVAFDAMTESDDGYGGQTKGWSEQFSTRAEFIYKSGGEAVEAARLTGKSIFTVRLRSFSDSRAILPEWRMRDTRRGTVYNVRSVDAVADRRHVFLTVESGVVV